MPRVPRSRTVIAVILATLLSSIRFGTLGYGKRQMVRKWVGGNECK